MKEDEAIVYVESVTDYLNALPEGDEFFDTLLDKLVLYRGQGNKNWSLMPGVMRDREDYLNEELYIKECLRQYPEEFKNMSKIDILIKMQHYGIPTRLLDLTSNPLVALYFACASQPKEDGVVYVTQGPVARSSDLAIKILAEFVFSLKSHDRIWSKNAEKLIRSKLDATDFMGASDDYVKFIITANTPLLFEADWSNPRIKNQEGYFAIYRGLENWQEILCLKQIYVKKECKESIIAQLGQIGITASRIFPELINGTKYITSSIRKRNLQFNKQFQTPFDKLMK